MNAARWSASSPRGEITRTGFMLPFHRGFEQIVKHAPAPIIPVCLDQVWGSIFSYYGGRFFWKWPQEMPVPGDVAFGKPLPPTRRAAEVRQAIQKLSADCAVAHAPDSAGRSTASSSAWPPATRSARASSTAAPTATAPQLRRGAGRRRCASPGACGRCSATSRWSAVWLPPGVGGALANIALALLGKTSVNLNYTAVAGGRPVAPCASAAAATSSPPGASRQRVPLDPGPGVELIYLEDLLPEDHQAGRSCATFLSVHAAAGLVPGTRHARPGPAHGRRPGDGHLLQRQHRRAQGRDADARQHRRQRASR